ncbi:MULTISPECIES: rhomboid family intramembrane serine protease [Thermocrispum]|uniref:Rhomboid family intramembrane serine protease n=1 Tax=Thermocrispum agreste TaxID=37925 RepID=A0A2W4JPZ4_9PSEU|nr:MULTISPECIES: rhomboid family intramembrane serine protease [Thermocrispum]PZN01041.1 MAG: rhomboid family intramembrane serine protease [Thermocrispum agreste]
MSTPPLPGTPSTTTGAKRVDKSRRVLPPNPKAAALVAVGFTVLLYLIELVDVVLPANLDAGGIQPREADGLLGVLFAPLLHGSWEHLAANSIPVLLFAFLTMAGGIGQWIAVSATIWLIGGLGVWLIGPPDTVHIGASGLAFGWLAFLLVRGIFNRAPGQLVLAVVLFLVYGGMLWGVLPGAADISWQGHLFGALAGVLAAWLVAKADRSMGKAGPSAGASTPPAPPLPPGNLAA